MTDERAKLRISNADREQAIEALQRALDEGRIDLGEFDERAKTVYGAKTNAELDLLFDDLPSDRAEDKSVHTIELTDQERAEREAAVRERVDCVPGPGLGGLRALRGLVLVGGITTAIWVATSIASGEFGYFWPIWPIIGMAMATCMQWMGRGRSH